MSFDKITDLPWHPDNMSDCWAIDITEEGFEAMKNDTAYEAGTIL